MSDPGKAVFLSYASQDAVAAKRICDALRAAGVEVWFDQSELVGGDAWDSKIRKQIKECALLIPIISANTQSRTEGYFRLEWRLADQRTHLMAKGRPFLLPVVIDDTRDAGAHVPDSFTEVQWTKAPGGEVPATFTTRVNKLLEGSGDSVGGALRPDSSAMSGHNGPPTQANRRPGKWWWALPVLGVAVASFFVVQSRWRDLSAVPAAVKSPPPGADATMSEARQLVARAQLLHENMGGSTRGDFELAGDLLKRALELAPLDAEVWAHYSWFCNNMYGVGMDRSPERDAEIKRSADRAFKLDPKSPMARMAWANYYRRQPAAREAAIRMLRELVQEHPDNVVMLRVLASALRFQRASLEEALVLLARAAALPGGDSHAWTTRGDILSGLGRTAEAEAAYDRSLEIRRAPRVLVRKALLLMRRTGDYAAAEKLLSQVPGDFVQEDRFVGVASQLALLQRKPERCLEILEGFPREYVEDGNYVMLCASKGSLAGLARWEQGKPELARLAWAEGLRSVEQRLAIKRTDETLLWDKGFLLAALNRRSEAEEVATLFGQLAPSNGPWMRAMIDAWTGEKERALQFLASQPPTPHMGIGPLWGPLLDEPEFKRMVAVAIAAASSTPEFARPSLTRGAADETDDKSVAVLAFANLSDDKANEYFSDGISEELLNVLAKIPGLKVSARTSAFYFKGKEVPIPEIAKQLGVAYVVEGSVRKSGDKVRITAQLIKASDGFHVWSDTFTRDIKDVFAVQDEIAGLIAKNLELKMGMGAAGARQAVSPEAYQEFLVGRAAAAKASMADLSEAVGHFERAVALEPKYTAAWVQLASAHTRLGRWGGAPTLASWAAARAAIDRALALEPDSPEVLLALGWILRTAEWDWRGAERAFRRALALQPNNPEILAGTAVLLFNIGQRDEAFRLARRAVQLDPLNPSTQVDLSIMFFESRNWVESERAARRALQLAPGGTSYHSVLAWPLINQGRYAEAEAELALDPDVVEQSGTSGLLALARGDQAKVREMLARLEGLAKTQPDLADLQTCIAWLHAGLGDKDRAFAALEKARISRDPSMAWLRDNTELTVLFSDPRWGELLRKIGLADEQLK